MNRFVRIALSVFVFVVTIRILGEVFDLRARCRDRWMSPSIGRQGACSSHGGVDNSAYRNAFVFSIIVSVLAYNFDRTVNFISHWFIENSKNFDQKTDRTHFSERNGPQHSSKEEEKQSEIDPRTEEEILQENAYYQKKTEEYIARELEKTYWRPPLEEPLKKPPAKRKSTKRKSAPWR